MNSAVPLSRDAGVAEDLGLLIEAVAPGKYPWVQGRFVTAPPAGSELLPCRSLLDPDAFGGILERFGAQYGVADRRAIASLWTMYYFSALMVGGAVAWLELRRVLPLSLEEAQVALNPDTGAPVAFVLPHLGEYRAGLPPHQALHGMIRDHAAPLAAALAITAGISPKLVWGNAAGYLSWIIRETGRLTDPALAVEGLPVLDDPVWPDGWRNPLSGAVRQECDAEGNGYGRRRVCCLRYLVPGVAGCGMTCPLPEGRA